ANLESLAVTHFRFAPVGSPVAARTLGPLRRLELDGADRCRPDAVARLGQVLPDNARARELSLARLSCRRDPVSGLSAADFCALPALPQLRTLERLSLTLREIPDAKNKVMELEGVRAITGAPWWRTIRSFRPEAGGYPRAWWLSTAETKIIAAAPP